MEFTLEDPLSLIREAIKLRKPSIVPQLGYTVHPEFQKYISGIDLFYESHKSLVETYRRLGINFVWHTAKEIEN